MTRARYEETQNNFPEVVRLYEEASNWNAQPVQELDQGLRDFLVRLKDNFLERFARRRTISNNNNINKDYTLGVDDSFDIQVMNEEDLLNFSDFVEDVDRRISLEMASNQENHPADDGEEGRDAIHSDDNRPERKSNQFTREQVTTSINPIK